MKKLPEQPASQLPLIVLYALTLFTSAALMFAVQPLFGKLLLPALGGSPAVWNTCMVFYQSLLFLGYSYAHLLSRRLRPAWQIAAHLPLLILSALALPVGLPETLSPPTNDDPTFWLLITLGAAIGLPFFVLSTTAPLLQKWFSQLGHSQSHDPYFLYAASNTGSLLSLLAYPFLLEPHLGLLAQQRYWSISYGLLIVLVAVCALCLWRSHGNATPEQADNAPAPLSARLQLRWLALAFVPSSLLLGLTNFISTDIASVPLLWVIPLTVYLLTFIIVFSRFYATAHPWLIRLQAIFAVPFLAFAFVNPADLPYWLYLILHVVAFFLAALVCHGELARLRPSTHYLTRYYLIMSLAGMLGGLFNTFAAPFLFNGIYEYPLMIVAALLLRPGWTSIKTEGWRLLPPALVLAVGFALYFNAGYPAEHFDTIAISLMLAAALTWLLRQYPLSYGLSVGSVILLALGVHGLTSKTLYQERTFFGVLAVRASTLINEQGQPEIYHELYHGTTKHGAQRLPAALSTTPLTYYSRPGPMGQLFKTFADLDANWRIGSVGLGAGALACYAKPGQHWTMYEIDPLVVAIASNPAYFSYLSQCNRNAEMRVGDARLSLTKEADHSFDLLLMDAFSSDAVPTHLLTEEALKLYFQKLKPNGILAFHITNRHLALKKILSIHAEHQHLAALIQEFPAQENQPLVVATDWVVLAQNPATLQALAESPLGHWQKMPLYFDMPPWTDDFTNIVSIWK